MTDKSLVHLNPLDIEAPEPNAVFINRVINPRNVSITEDAIARRDKPLSRKQVKQYRKELKVLERTLNEGAYEGARQEWETLKERWVMYRIELRELKESPLGEDEKLLKALEIRQSMNGLAQRGRQIQQGIKELIPVARRYRALSERLDSHYTAIEQRKLHNHLRQELGKEVEDFKYIIIERWSQLGYKFEWMKGNKRHVDKVRFSEIHVTPDQVFLKIDTTLKTFFGFKSTLPQGVKVMDLVSKDTLTELSTSCQRQVQGKITLNNGAWVIINRLGTTDGLLNYLTLEQVLSKYDHRSHHALPIPVGVGSGRVVSWIHLTQHPHFLIGGSTGGGKSNIENVFICTLIQKHAPSEVRFVLIDLKEGLEFRTYENVPHLLTKPITQVEQAATVVAQLEALRKQRAEQFSRVWARTLEEYNARVKPEKRMPRIIVVFDEFAAIQVSRELEGTIQSFILQLLNKGRAVGIHIVLCTQNPSVDIIPGASKANMAFRIAGAMPTKSASMTILGTGDAAELPEIKGRMVAMVGAKFWQIQTPHARPEDIERAILAAHEWPEAPDILLPEPTEKALGFTVEMLLEIALDDFNGKLSYRPIYEAIKSSENITALELREMIKSVVSRGEISFRGQLFGFKKVRGGGYSLCPKELVLELA